QTGDREACVLGVQRGRGPVGRDRPPDKPEPAGGGGPPTGVPGSGTWGGSEAGESTSRRLYCALAHPKQCEGRFVDLQRPAGGDACDGAPARPQRLGTSAQRVAPRIANRRGSGSHAGGSRPPRSLIPADAPPQSDEPQETDGAAGTRD